MPDTLDAVPTVPARGAFRSRLMASVLSLTVIVFAIAPAIATSIATDLWIYQTGDTVNVTGDGFWADEQVELVTTDPYGVETDRGTVSADAGGFIAYSFVLLSDVPGIYDILATGLSSGLTAATQFDPVNVAITNSGLTYYASGADITISGTYSCTGGGGAPNCTTFVPTNIVVGIFLTNLANNTTGPTPVVGLSATLTPGSGMTATNSTSGTWTKTFIGGGTALADGAKYDAKATFTFTPGTSASPQSNVKDEIIGSDKTAPLAPAVTGVTPASPANNNGPSVSGTAEGNAAVAIYNGAGCPGSPVATGAANNAGNFNIAVSVADNTSQDFYAKATDAVGNASPCSSSHAVYIEDSTAPAAPGLTGSTPPSPSSNDMPTINGTAEAGATVRLYKQSDCGGSVQGSPTVASPAFAILVNVGNNTETDFYATATDAAGNLSPCSTTHVIYKSDNNAPTVTILTMPANPTFSTAAGFTFSGSDTGGGASGINRYECRIDGVPADFATCSSPFSQVVAVGAHTFYVRAVDNAGNVGVATSYAWTVNASDTTVNQPTLESPSNGSATNDSTPTFGWSDVTDPSTPVSYVLQYVAKGATCNFGAATTVSALSLSTYTPAPSIGSDGIYCWRVKALDGLANDSGYTAAFEFTLDTAGPIISVNAKTTDTNPYVAGTWTNQDVTVAFTCSDGSGSGLSVNTVADDGGIQSAETSTGSFTGLGIHCVDNAGNAAVDVPFGPIKIDKTKPVISGSASPSANANGWNNSDVVVSFSCAEAGSVQSGIFAADNTVAGQTLTAETSGTTVPNSGSCTDKAGNLADSASVGPIKIDKTAPSVTIDFPLASAYVQSTWEAGCATAGVGDFCGTAEDALSGLDGNVVASIQRLSTAKWYDWVAMTFTSDTETFTPVGGAAWNKAFAYSNFPTSGDYRIHALAQDAAGNSGQASRTLTLNRYTIDFQAPLDDTILPGDVIKNVGKYGRVIPVKVLVYKDNVLQNSSNFAAADAFTIAVNYMPDCVSAASDTLEAYADAGMSNAGSNLFRWADGQLIYNLDTKAALPLSTSAMYVNKCYRLDVYLNGAKLSYNRIAVFYPVK